MSTFDVDVLKEVVHEAIEAGTSLEDTLALVQLGLAQRYPGQVVPSPDWYMVSAGGGTQQVLLLHASVTEYLTLVGIPLPTDGFSGRYPTTITDVIIDGELANYRPGDTKPSRYAAGDVSVFEPHEGRNWTVEDRVWMLEYAEGMVPAMFALPLMDTAFGTLDWRSMAEMTAAATVEMARSFTSRFTWRNWFGNQTCQPLTILRPHGVDDLAGAVKAVHHLGLRCRPFGNKHSWSALVPTDDVLIDMNGLQRVLDIEPPGDDGMGYVTIECGATVGELTKAAVDAGMYVRSPTVAIQFTVGGLLATGSHGTGVHDQTFSDGVVAMTIVKADGSIVEAKQGDPDWEALLVGLGAFGVVYSVKVACPKLVNVRCQRFVMPIDEAVERIPEFLEAHAGMELYWVPYTDHAYFNTFDPTDDAITWGWFQHAVGYVGQNVLEGTIGQLAVDVVARIPRLTPAFNNLVAATFGPFDEVKSPLYAYHYQYYYPLCLDAEFSVPTEDAQAAWRLYLDTLERFRKERGLYPINMVVHSRFIAADEAWLSPDYERPSCYVESVTAKGTKGAIDFYKEIEQELNARFETRAHWGKLWYDLDVLKTRYPKLAQWEAARKRWDPKGTFLNDLVARITDGL